MLKPRHPGVAAGEAEHVARGEEGDQHLHQVQVLEDGGEAHHGEAGVSIQRRVSEALSLYPLLLYSRLCSGQHHNTQLTSS